MARSTKTNGAAFLTTAAVELGVQPRRVRAMIAAGRLGATQIGRDLADLTEKLLMRFVSARPEDLLNNAVRVYAESRSSRLIGPSDP